MENIDSIKAQINTLDVMELNNLLEYIKKHLPKEERSILSNLKKIKIEDSSDFSENIDKQLYSGQNE